MFWQHEKYHYLCDRFSPNFGGERLNKRILASLAQLARARDL